MKSEDEIKKMIIDRAISDNRIRAVLLNGSRANNKVRPDKLQDFDVVYIVQKLDSFISDHSWTNIFGEKLIRQLPDEMTFGKTKKNQLRFHYLMLFKEGYRIDLTLLQEEEIKKGYHLDSLSIVWLDKDNVFSNISDPTDFDYWIQKPTEKEFVDTCNEFWWVCTNVAKGFLRSEIIYAKEMFETIVRVMFMKMIAWYIGCHNNFSVSIGKGGKFIQNFLSPTQYDKILLTYSGKEIKNNWNSLFIMTELFSEFALSVADKLNFKYNIIEEQNVKEYLKKIYNTFE